MGRCTQGKRWEDARIYTDIDEQRVGVRVDADTDELYEDTPVDAHTDEQREGTRVDSAIDEQWEGAPVDADTDEKWEGAPMDADTDEQWEGAPMDADTVEQWEGAPVDTDTEGMSGCRHWWALPYSRIHVCILTYITSSNGKVHKWMLTQMSNVMVYSEDADGDWQREGIPNTDKDAWWRGAPVDAYIGEQWGMQH